MYDVYKTVAIIKSEARKQKIPITEMLSNLGLSKNALSSMSSRGSWISSDSLARIADYLGVSVDYLLGRELPESVSSNAFIAKRPEMEWIALLSQMDDDDLTKVRSYVEFLVSQKK